ncbi:MAG: HutD family protein [Hyphomicrobiales bacterium]|nr:HutD family protein [Hyphomicrobiales bacterium]
MQVLRAANYRRMPWKNGGGETSEIAVYPAGAGLETFGWRVSMARIASDGPFSAFPGVERTLSVLEGDGVVLEIEGREAVRLTPASAPYKFAADAATSARLIGGPILDLNVMTRRGRHGHVVTRHKIEGELTLAAGVDRAMLICAGETVLASGQGVNVEIGRYDALTLDGAQEFRVTGIGEIFAVELNAG